MVNPSTGTTGSAIPIRTRPSDDFGGLQNYLEQAAWQKMNQARAMFISHMDPHSLEDVEKAWEEALLTKADQIRKERSQKFWEQMVALVFPDGQPSGDTEKTA